MSPLALHLLRRVAVYALALAFLLAVVPWGLTELGFLGPTPAEHIEAAARVLEAARAYGATAEQPAFKAGLAALDRARQLAAAQRGREARRAATEAREDGVAAQRHALATREEARGRAKRLVDATDDLMNELEDLYTEAAAGKTKAQTASLLSLMKEARRVGAGLFLAYEQEDYARVLADEPAATEILVGARSALKEAGKKP
jgi:hypothetical protein